jgi:hypothetical protein
MTSALPEHILSTGSTSGLTLILVGLRGVGKTVLLNELGETADHLGFKSAIVEAHESKTLPELLVPPLRTILFALSTIENAKDKARRGLRALKGCLKVQIGDVGLSIDPENGLADSGDIEADLPALIVSIGEAAKDASVPVALLVDELQYLSPEEFSALKTFARFKLFRPEAYIHCGAFGPSAPNALTFNAWLPSCTRRLPSASPRTRRRGSGKGSPTLRGTLQLWPDHPSPNRSRQGVRARCGDAD